MGKQTSASNTCRASVIAVLFILVAAPEVRSESPPRRVVIKDEGGKPNGPRGQVCWTNHVLRKILNVDFDPAAIRSAKLLYRMHNDPYDVPSRRTHSGMVKGVKWANIVILINGKEVLSGPMGVWAKMGWHELKLKPDVLRRGENVIIFKHDGSGPSYFYLASNSDSPKGRSASSKDSGGNFRINFLTPGSKSETPGPSEYIVRLRLDVADNRPAFEVRDGQAYGWLEPEDFFGRKRYSADGWKAASWTNSPSRPSRGLMAYSLQETTMNIPFELPLAGKWYAWVRTWQDGFRGGRFELAWNDRQFFSSEDHRFSGDVDLRFDWLNCGSAKLAKGKNLMTISTFSKSGHMFDVIVLTTDPKFVPDEKNPLPAMPVTKQDPPEGITRPEPGPYMMENPVPWAKPTAGGPLRTFWVCGDINELEIVELARRLDMKYDVLSSPTAYYGRGLFGQDLALDQTDLLHQALAEGQDYEVLVLVRVNLDQIPIDIQKIIADKVRGGMGLVSVRSRREKKKEQPIQELFREIEHLPIDTLQSCLNTQSFPSVYSRKFGKGRVLRVSYKNFGTMGYAGGHPAGVPYPLGEPLLAKWAKYLLLAAARTEDAPDIVSIEFDPPPKAVTTGRAVKVSVTCRRGAGQELRIDAVCYPPWEGGPIRASSPVKNGKTEISIPLGAENGIYRLQLSLKNDRNETYDFAAADLIARGSTTIEKLVLPKERLKSGSKVPVTVQVQCLKPEAGTPVVATAELLGAHDRLLGKAKQAAELTANQTDISLSLPSIPSHDWFARVRVTVSNQNGQIIERRQGKVFIRQPAVFDDYWSGAGMFINKELTQYVRHVPGLVYEQLGMNATLMDGSELDAPIPRGLRLFHIFRVTEAGNPDSTGDGARVPCMHDPAFLEKFWPQMRNAAITYQHNSSLTMGLGDETRVGSGREVCWSEHTLNAFRSELKVRYGTAVKLNEAWKTQFKEFSDAVPWRIEEAIKRPDNLAPWLEFRLFMAGAFADLFKKFSRECREAAPDVVVGGANPFAPTIQRLTFFPDLFEAVDFASVYPRFFDRARCFIRNMRTTTIWTGYERSHQRMENEVWLTLAYGGTMVGWFGVDRTFYGSLTGTFGLSDRARWIKAINEGVNEGTGKLLLQGEVEPAPVAILLSKSSLLAYTAAGLAANPQSKPEVHTWSFESYREAYIRLLNAAHVQYDYVTDKQIAAGLPAQYRVLILPRSVAVSDVCVREIQKFALSRAVILDKSFGVANELGIRRVEQPELEGRNVTRYSGEPLRTTKGNRKGFSEVLASVGAMSREQITGSVNRVVRKLIGKGRLIVAFGRGEVTFRFPDAAHNYDIREHRYLGLADTIKLSRRIGPLAVLRLPYEVTRLKLAAPKRSRPGKEIKLSLNLKAKGGDPGQHVVRVEVFGPDEKPRRLYGRNVLCKDGKGAASFWLAWNDPPGDWRITARDIASGLRAERTVRVKR